MIKREGKDIKSDHVTLKTGVKVAENSEINYILKCIKTENSCFKFFIIFHNNTVSTASKINATLVNIKGLFKKHLKNLTDLKLFNGSVHAHLHNTNTHTHSPI